MIDRLTLLALVAAMALGAAGGQPLLIAVGAFGLLLGALDRLWYRRCLEGIDYRRQLSAERVLWGESITLQTEIVNRKLLPLFWLKLEDRVPEDFNYERALIVRDDRRVYSYLTSVEPMLPYERAQRRYTVHCRRRGRFEFGPARVESGDLLGRRRRQGRFAASDHLLVYPKLLELDLAAPLARRLVGRRTVDRLIIDDPSRMVGVRSYQPGDPVRSVEWRASARAQELMVRVFEPTSDPSLAVFVNFHVLAPTPARARQREDHLEFAISLAASLARFALGAGYPSGIYGNGVRGEMEAVRVPVSSDALQLRSILEALALATAFGRRGLAELLLEECRHLPFEASVAVVSFGLDARLAAALQETARRRPVNLFLISADSLPAPSLPGVRTTAVAYLEGWEDLAQISLAG